MEHLTEKIDRLFAENRGPEAEKLLKQALQEAYEGLNLAGAVPILNELIGYCRETSQVEHSYAYAQEVQDILQKLGMEGTLPHATTLLNIANAYRAGGRLEDSLHFYEKAAGIYSKLLTAEDMLWASFYNNISLLYQEMGRFEPAKESLLKALDIVLQKKDTIFEQAVTYTNLANTCLHLGQGDEAEKYFTGAILLFERYNIRDAHYCAALAALGTYLYQKQEYEKAEGLFVKAMEGIEASLGQNAYYQRMKENVQICRSKARLQAEVHVLQAQETSKAEQGAADQAGGQQAQEGSKAEQGAADQAGGQQAQEGSKAEQGCAVQAGGQQAQEGCKAEQGAAVQAGEQQVQETSKAEQGAAVQTGEQQAQETSGEEAVSGLALCREYYEVCCRPMLEKQFSQYVDKIAVGLVGEGSDCFGYDDMYSKDHDWGPSLLLWVSDEVYEEIGAALEAAYKALPREYGGNVYKESIAAQGRRGVQRIGDFYRRLLGAENCPQEGQLWNPESICWESIEESGLAAAVNGEVFTDKNGVFSQIRELLQKGYPQRLRYLKIAEAAARFSQSGQYNYARMLKRGDRTAAWLMLVEAAKEALRLLYYMTGEYPPHDKWLVRGLKEKAEFGQVLGLVESLFTEKLQDKAKVLEQIGEQLALLLYRRDYISDVGGFLQEHVNELLFKASVMELSIEELAENIARTEFEAFDKVKNQGGRADCQDDWFTFSIMRKSQYLTWNQDMLVQYLYDFTREYARGHNLVEEKYGRMMESTAPAEYERLKLYFPVLGQEKKQIIEEIVSLQVKWMEEFAARFPKLAGNARSIHTYEDHLFNTSYETYLRGEISTYSDKMLELYGRYIVEYVQAEKNPARDIMEHSVWMYGYEGLDQAEEML